MSWIWPCWALLGVIGTRWTVGGFIKDQCAGYVSDPDELLLAGLIALFTLVVAPLLIPAALVLGIWKSPLGRWIKIALVKFYYLDREQRKRMLNK